MKSQRHILTLCTALLLGVTVAHAQEDQTGGQCPVIAETALRTVEVNCDGTDRNQACYGNTFLQAELAPTLPIVPFEKPGDTVSITDIESLRLSAMDLVNNTWGVALMQVSAADGATNQPEDMTFLFFGDVEVDNAGRFAFITLEADTTLYTAPDADSAVAGVLTGSSTVTATGRTADGAWVQAVISPETGDSGWMQADALPADTLDTLRVIDPAAPPALDDLMNAPQYGPMQAFYFRSGADDAPCPEAANSGVMIQTPEGVAEMTVWIDEVVLQMQGTAYLQAQPGGDLTLYTLEGSAEVEAGGAVETTVAGTEISVPLNEALVAVDAPSDPEPYDLDALQGLPVDLLPREIEIADPLDTTTIEPTAGAWAFNWGVDEAVCPDGSTIDLETAQSSTPLVYDAAAEAVTVLDVAHFQTAPNTYTAVYVDEIGSAYQNTLRVEDAATISGESQVNFGDCAVTLPFTLTLAD